MQKRYQTRVVYVDAIKWDGQYNPLISSFIPYITGNGDITLRTFISTEKGLVEIHKGNWIITDEKGYKSVLSDDAFNHLYEPFLTPVEKLRARVDAKMGNKANKEELNRQGIYEQMVKEMEDRLC